MEARQASRSPVAAALAPDLSITERLMRELVGCEDNNVTARAADHHLRSGGARTRATLALTIGNGLGLPQAQRVALAASAELIHNASLIHDDIQDESLARRGREALWARFGTGIAISVGDLYVSAAWAALARARLAEYRHADAAGRMHRAVHTCISGQNDELALRSGPVTVTHYERIVAAKSGALLALPADIVVLAAGQGRWCRVIGKAARGLAVAYQIADDLADVESDCCPRTSGRSCLNIVLLLAGQQVAEPSSVAARLARLRLGEVGASIENLPEGARRAFAGLIDRVRARLPA